MDDGASVASGVCVHPRAGHVESGSIRYGAYAAMRVCDRAECQALGLLWAGRETGYGEGSARFVADPPGYLERVKVWIAEARMRWTLEDGAVE